MTTTTTTTDCKQRRPRQLWLFPDAGPVQLLVGDIQSVIRDIPTGSVHTIVADPPYNLGKAYPGYDDRPKARARFLDYLIPRLAGLLPRLQPTGNLWLMLPSSLAATVWPLLLSACPSRSRWKILDWIVWATPFGRYRKDSFPVSVRHIWRIGTPGTAAFYPDAIRVPSARQLVYRDRRANRAGRIPDSVWVPITPDLERRVPDIWCEPNVVHQAHERRHTCPVQTPIPIVERMLLCTTRPGDTVLDPFLGSGVTAIVARRLNRHFIGVDIDPSSVEATHQWLETDSTRAALNA